jgi:hypothetical protein
VDCCPIAPLEVDWDVAVNFHEPLDKHEEPVETSDKRHADDIMWDENREKERNLLPD